MKIQAAVHFDRNQKLGVRELDLEEPRADEVLIKTVACGVCHTDIWVQKNYTNTMLLGHEASGIVVTVGCEVEGLTTGDHLVTAYNWCGECESCKMGKTWECDSFSDNFDGLRPDGTTPFSLDGKPVMPLMREGGFSSYIVCQKHSVIKVNPALDLKTLGPLGCGIMTGAGSVLNHLKPKAGHPIAVFGTGCVGLSAVMAARISGCDPIIAVDRVPARLKLAKELGATYSLNGEDDNLAKTIKTICEGVDYAFDTSGSSRMLEAMRHVLNPGATACGVGIGGSLSLTERERKDGKNWATTDTGFSVPPVFIPKLLEYHKTGVFPFEKMLRFYRFDKINEAFAANRELRVVKPVVLMEQ